VPYFGETHDVNDPIEMLQPLVLEHPGIQIVFEMEIIYAKADHVEADVSERFRILQKL
jgi:hypothetical protein